MLPLRRRIVPILAVLFGAPITAEYLQAYLSFTGDPLALLAGLLFLGPLYGAAALLIREAAVRSGRGWPGVLLLAAAFGVAMPGVIDLALFGEHRADVAYWAELREPTLMPPLGISGYQTLTWIAGHVVMSVGVPLALLYRFAPAHRGRPLLGRVGLVVLGVLFAVTAAMVHADGRRIYDYAPTAAQITAVTAVVVAVGGLAFTALGRPTAPKPVAPQRVNPVFIALLTVAAVAVPGLFPPTWIGVAVQAGVLIIAAVTLRWLSLHREWGAREVGLLAASAVVGGTLMAFLNPTPNGVSAIAKIAQGMVFLVLAVAIAVLAQRAERPPPGLGCTAPP